LAQSDPADRSAVRGRALFGASLLAWAEGAVAVAAGQAAESIALFRTLGDRDWLARALMMLGSIQVTQGQPPPARAAVGEGRTLLKEQGLRMLNSFVLQGLGEASFASHDVLEARTFYQQSLAIFRQEGDMLGEGAALGALGIVAAAQGEVEAAQSLLTQSLP